MKSPRNARVISEEELGTMSKNNLKSITLGIGIVAMDVTGVMNEIFLYNLHFVYMRLVG